MRRGTRYTDDGQRETLDLGGPCSPNQWGAVLRHWARLGLPIPGTGPELDTRLRLTAALAGLPGRLSSTRDLTAGQAGQVLRALASCRNVADAEKLAYLYSPDAAAHADAQQQRTRAVVAALAERIGQ